MQQGIVDVFQEAMLIEAVLGIALLAMIWAGFQLSATWPVFSGWRKGDSRRDCLSNELI